MKKNWDRKSRVRLPLTCCLSLFFLLWCRSWPFPTFLAFCSYSPGFPFFSDLIGCPNFFHFIGCPSLDFFIVSLFYLLECPQSFLPESRWALTHAAKASLLLSYLFPLPSILFPLPFLSLISSHFLTYLFPYISCNFPLPFFISSLFSIINDSLYLFSTIAGWCTVTLLAVLTVVPQRAGGVLLLLPLSLPLLLFLLLVRYNCIPILFSTILGWFSWPYFAWLK